MTITRVTTQEGKTFAKAIQTLEKKVAKVGWFEKSRYPEPPNVPVAYVATIQEFGDPTHNIPPRPFMRTTIASKKTEWADLMKQGVASILKGNTKIENVMDAIGLKAAGDIRKTISLIHEPALSQRTIDARLAKRSSNVSKSITVKRLVDNKNMTAGINKPLIDTGLMIATLTNTVENE